MAKSVQGPEIKANGMKGVMVEGAVDIAADNDVIDSVIMRLI